MPIRILLADDHKVFCQALGQSLEAEPDMELIGEAGTGTEMVELALHHLPDLVVADVRMPGLCGIGATRQISAQAPQIKVLILTRFAKESYLAEALGAGASGYVLKNAPIDELLFAIRSVAGGNVFVSPPLQRFLVRGYREWSAAQEAPPSASLTSREKEVLQLVADGLSSQRIAAELGINVRTVETHRANMMRKLAIHNTAELVCYAVRNHLVTEPTV